MSIGLSGGGPFSLGLGRQRSAGAVAVDIRIVDATTSQVIEVVHVREALNSSAFDVSLAYRNVAFGSREFWSTPVGEASKRVIDRAVEEISQRAAKRPWEGLIVEFDGAALTINAGASSGVKLGDRFAIEHVERVMTDPRTGEILGKRKKRLGTIEIKEVDTNFAAGTFIPTGERAPVRGDLVVQLQ